MSASSGVVDLKVAVVVDPSLPLGLLANTVATISIGLGAADVGLGAPTLEDRLGVTVWPSATVSVPVLQAPADALAELARRATDTAAQAVVVPFPAFARSMHDFAAYRSEFSQRALRDEAIHGVGLAGTRKWVAALTGSLKLLS